MTEQLENLEEAHDELGHDEIIFLVPQLFEKWERENSIGIFLLLILGYFKTKPAKIQKHFIILLSFLSVNQRQILTFFGRCQK